MDEYDDVVHATSILAWFISISTGKLIELCFRGRKYWLLKMI